MNDTQKSTQHQYLSGKPKIKSTASQPLKNKTQNQMD